MRRGAATALLAVLLAVLLVPAGPAQAADVAAGAAAFAGTSHMPMSPCDPPDPSDGLCQGVWNGTFTGAFGGQHTRADGRVVPWSVEIDAPGAATLRYAAPDGASACAAGLVRGRATIIAGGPNQAWGAYGNAALVPAAIVGAELSLAFEWHRLATAGPLVVTSLSIRLDVYGVGWVTVVDESRSVSVAGAAALIVPDEPPDCVTQTPGALDGALRGVLSGIAVRPD